MNVSSAPARKITISLSNELVEFADQQALKENISRSQIIGQALAVFKAREEAVLAAEGYQIFAREAEEFAEMSAAATAEAWTAMGNDWNAG